MGFKTNVTGYLKEMDIMGMILSDEEMGKVVRGKVIQLFRSIVRETPQWSGAAASNWHIELGISAGVEKPSGWSVIKKKENAFRKGDEPAVQKSLSANSHVNSIGKEFMHGCVISNPQAYVEMLEKGDSEDFTLRFANIPGRMVERAKARHGGVERLNRLTIEYYKREQL